MVELKIDNVKVVVEENTTILDAAQSVGIKIPTLCHLKGFSPTGACRICIVEISGVRGLIPSCAYPVQANMEVKTNSNRVRVSRKTIVELLVENHPQDCLICVRNKNCELQDFSSTYSLREHKYIGKKKPHALDISTPGMERDPAMCILCGRCVRVCGETQKIGAIDFTNRGFLTNVTTPYDIGLNVSDCILCGQCILVCPTSALREKSSLREVNAALQNNKHVVVQIAPAVRAALGEEYNLPLGTNVIGKMITGLRRLGFDKVFDTNFGADLTIMEESAELIKRVQNSETLPMFTSCCPGWVKYIEQNRPQLLNHLSSCKSPHEMEGAVLKTYYAKKANIAPEDIYVVSIMPCTVKKFEADRPELSKDKLQNVDAVLTTRELVRLFNMYGIDFINLPDEDFDNPLGEASGAGAIFGASGGVMEAALRTAYYKLTGVDLEMPEFQELRGNSEIKETTVSINEMDVKIAVVNGIGSIGPILDDIEKGESPYHFIEVMACPGGCINGGGQPINQITEKVVERAKVMYKIDKDSKHRMSYENESIQKVYDECLIEPGSHKAHEILHTTYVNRKEILRANVKPIK